MAKKRYSTLKEISEKLNLNVSTVSRALKEHPDISLETRKRVQEMASLLDYKPNTFATSLRTNQTKLLGIIVSSITNLFYDSFIGTIEEKAREDGYSVLILQSGENVESELKNLEILKKNRVDGIFVSITSNTKDVSAFMEMEKKGIPMKAPSPLSLSLYLSLFGSYSADRVASPSIVRHDLVVPRRKNRASKKSQEPRRAVD